MAKGRAAPEIIAGIVEGGPRAWWTTAIAGPILILAAVLFEATSLSTPATVAIMSITSALGWMVAVGVLWLLKFFLSVREFRGHGSPSLWVSFAVILVGGAAAGALRTLVLIAGGSVAAIPQVIEPLARTVIAAQAGMVWVVIASLIGLAARRYVNIRAATLNYFAGEAVDHESIRREERAVLSQVSESVQGRLAATAEKLANSIDNRKLNQKELAESLHMVTREMRDLSHALALTETPSATAVPISLREIIVQALRNVKPPIGLIMWGITLMFALIFAGEISRLGLLVVARTTLVVFVGAFLATLVARWAWVKWPSLRIVVTICLAACIALLLPADLFIATLIGDSASLALSIQRLVLAPINALVLLLVITVWSCREFTKVDWQHSVGLDKIDALRAGQAHAAALQLSGQALHGGPLSRLHAAVLALGMLDENQDIHLEPGNLSSAHATLASLQSDLESLSRREFESVASSIVLSDLAHEAIRRWGAFAHVTFSIPPELNKVKVAHEFSEIVAEAVTNAVRHGRARDIYIEVVDVDGAVLITVSDNGRGFDVSAISEPGQGTRDLDRLTAGSWHRELLEEGGVRLTFKTQAINEESP